VEGEEPYSILGCEEPHSILGCEEPHSILGWAEMLLETKALRTS